MARHNLPKIIAAPDLSEFQEVTRRLTQSGIFVVSQCVINEPKPESQRWKSCFMRSNAEVVSSDHELLTNPEQFDSKQFGTHAEPRRPDIPASAKTELS